MLVIVVAVFFEEQYLLYTKPLIPISLIFIYIFNSKTKSVYYFVSMILLLMNDTLVYHDFARYFDVIALILVLFYLFNFLLLKNYISFGDLKIRKLITFPIIISFILISYLTFSISQLVLPALVDSIISFFMILIALLLFVGICFFIYTIDKYYGNVRLFISASCCLFVSAFLLINYFYYYTRVFTILINIAEIVGLYFLLKFLIDAKPIQPGDESDNFF